METITYNILSKEALPLLNELERLHFIKRQNAGTQQINIKDRFEGCEPKQDLAELDAELKALRNEWN